jgi:hypothetical protein
VIQKHDGSACDHIVGGGLAAVPDFQRHFEDRSGVGGLQRLVGVPQFAIGNSMIEVMPEDFLGIRNQLDNIELLMSEKRKSRLT